MRHRGGPNPEHRMCKVMRFRISKKHIDQQYLHKNSLFEKQTLKNIVSFIELGKKIRMIDSFSIFFYLSME